MDKEELKPKQVQREYIPQGNVIRKFRDFYLVYNFLDINEEITRSRYQRICKNVAKNVKAYESADNRKKKVNDI